MAAALSRRVQPRVVLFLATIVGLRDCQLHRDINDMSIQSHLYVKDCACAGLKPCQHAFGRDGTCYELVEHPGGSRTCPAETTHCACPCQDEMSPCHNVQNTILSGETAARQCLDTYVMFGQSVCPAGSVHCRAYHQAKDAKSSTVAVVPTPAPLPANCPCTIEAPCRDRRFKVDAFGGQCQAYDSEGTCAAGLTQCLPTNITPKCVCGGGRPCQANNGMDCFEKGLDESAALKCPSHTRECDCPCPNLDPGSGPCFEKIGGQNFCFPLGSNNACSSGKVHCQRSSNSLGAGHTPQSLSTFPSHTTQLGAAVPVTGEDKKCIPNSWSAWEMCSKPCGGGLRARHATVFANEDPLRKCKRTERQNCNEHACVPQDCVEQIPDDWSECSMSCAQPSVNGLVKGVKGYQFKKPRVFQAAKDGGKPCAPSQKKQCNTGKKVEGCQA
jgi:hypothetical protein